MNPLSRPIMMFAVAAALSAALLTSLTASPAAARSGLNIEPGDRIEVIADALNVRAGPGLDEQVFHVVTEGMLGTVNDGPIEADGYGWYEVTFDAGGTGWVAGGYITLASDGGGIPGGTTVMVNTDWLNVRAEPGLGGAVVNVLPYGYQAFISDGPVSADGYTWYRLDAMGITLGWVAGEYLSGVDGGGGGLIDIGAAVVVNTDWLNFRDGAGLGAGIIDVLPYGTEATVIGYPASGTGDGYAWYQIELASGAIGWVAGSYIVEA